MATKYKTRWRQCFWCRRPISRGEQWVVLVNAHGRQYRVTVCAGCYQAVDHILLWRRLQGIQELEKVPT